MRRQAVYRSSIYQTIEGRAMTTLTDTQVRADAFVAPVPFLDVVRDIARAGLAALIVGFVVAGLGGRLVMRLDALLVPAATGAFTENGFPIGRITLEGSAGLIFFIGLAGAVFLGLVW